MFLILQVSVKFEISLSAKL